MCTLSVVISVRTIQVINKSVIGPVVQNVKNKAILVGIVSWGEKCETKKPDVFANVAKYSQWIIENTDCKKIGGFIACPNHKGKFKNLRNILKL